MKKIIILGVFFAFFMCADVLGQGLSVTCSSIRITGVISPTDLWIENPNRQQSIDGCRFLSDGSLFLITTTFFLDKVENGSTIRVATQQTPFFDNLPPGTYIASFSQPQKRSSFGCPNGNAVFDLANRNVGFMGVLVNPVSFPAQPIGVPEQSDNQYTFLNGNQNLLLPTLFDPNEDVKINTSACKDFDEYQINIQEFWFGDTNQPGRWMSSGYLVAPFDQPGFVNVSQRPLKATENLEDIWTYGGRRLDWEFIPGNSYRVQLTIRNSTCASWVDNLQTFFVCQPTWGCRNGTAETKTEPSISPNPVSRAFKVEGLSFNPVKSVSDELVISDLMGRTVKKFSNITGNEFDVSDLTSGAYFVSVLRDKHKMFTKKLMVSH